jgi:hypothetical protein
MGGTNLLSGEGTPDTAYCEGTRLTSEKARGKAMEARRQHAAFPPNGSSSDKRERQAVGTRQTAEICHHVH